MKTTDKQLKSSKPHLIPAIIASIMLFLALASWPFVYYQLLRFVVCGVAGYIAFTAYAWRKFWVFGLFGFIAILFNPIVPPELSRETWQIIDIVSAVVFVGSVFFLKEPIKVIRPLPTAFIWGAIWIIFASMFVWHIIGGNPLNELALIRRAQIISGSLVDTYEDEQEDYRGTIHYSEKGIYSYRLPDGREFKAMSRQVEEEREVEYLPDNPAVNRIKGDGCQSVTEWLLRKVILGGFFLALLVSPGIALLKNGVQEMKNIATSK